MSATGFVWAVEHPTRGKAHQVNWLDGRRLPARCGEIPSGDWRGYKPAEPYDGRLCVRCRDLSLTPESAEIRRRRHADEQASFQDVGAAHRLLTGASISDGELSERVADLCGELEEMNAAERKRKAALISVAAELVGLACEMDAERAPFPQRRTVAAIGGDSERVRAIGLRLKRIADGTPHATVDDMHPCANCGHPLAGHGKGAEPPIACEDFAP